MFQPNFWTINNRCRRCQSTRDPKLQAHHMRGTSYKVHCRHITYTNKNNTPTSLVIRFRHFNAQLFTIIGCVSTYHHVLTWRVKDLSHKDTRVCGDLNQTYALTLSFANKPVTYRHDRSCVFLKTGEFCPLFPPLSLTSAHYRKWWEKNGQSQYTNFLLAENSLHLYKSSRHNYTHKSSSFSSHKKQRTSSTIPL